MGAAAVPRGMAVWTAIDRVIVLLLVPVFVLGTPGFGPEDREFSNDVIPVVLAVVMLAPMVVALALSWKLPVPAAVAGMVGGLLLVATSVADVLGLIVGSPPAGMVVVDGLMLVVAGGIAWRSARIWRARPSV